MSFLRMLMMTDDYCYCVIDTGEHRLHCRTTLSGGVAGHAGGEHAGYGAHGGGGGVCNMG